MLRSAAGNSGSAVFHKKKGNQGAEAEDSGNDAAQTGESRGLVPSPKCFHQRQAEISDQHPRDAGENPGNHGNCVALLFIVGQGGNHGPVGNVHQGVGHAPQKVGDGDIRKLPGTAQTGVQEQKDKHDRVQDRSQQNPRAEPAPAGPGVVHHKPHDRIVDRIEETRGKKQIPDENRADFADVGQIEHEKGGDNRVNEILPEGSRAV